MAKSQRHAAGHRYEVHEVLEGAWKACHDDTRELWKGLAQLAVGVTHLRRGNEVGAVRLLTRDLHDQVLVVTEPGQAEDLEP